MLLVGERRYFLEAHSYRQAPISKIFFLYKLRCIAGPAWILFCRTVFQLLWGLTIVGGVIKYYEYRMIPLYTGGKPENQPQRCLLSVPSADAAQQMETV